MLVCLRAGREDHGRGRIRSNLLESLVQRQFPDKCGAHGPLHRDRGRLVVALRQVAVQLHHRAVVHFH